MGTSVLHEHVFPCQDVGSGFARTCHDGRVERVRIDKWLWAARFAKTRGAATELVLAGHVQVGGERVKPAREVRVGDRLEIRLGAARRTVVVTGLADRRGSASAAAECYEETEESLAERERQRLERRLSRPLGADLGARPTKQDRRRIEALRRAERRRQGR
jgi:ribosome-associated heat shock protein Hsp15